MAKFRKRPIIVEAVQWFKMGDHPQDEYWRSILPGDWIVTEKGIDTLHSNEQFAATYEPIEGEDKNEYRPWESEGITELAYWKKRYLELRHELAETEDQRPKETEDQRPWESM